jgi:hypothetical protein
MKHITCSLTNQFTSAELEDIQKHPSEYIPQNLSKQSSINWCYQRETEGRIQNSCLAQKMWQRYDFEIILHSNLLHSLGYFNIKCSTPTDKST